MEENCEGPIFQGNDRINQVQKCTVLTSKIPLMKIIELSYFRQNYGAMIVINDVIVGEGILYTVNAFWL